MGLPNATGTTGGTRAWVLLVALAGIWGSSFLFIKVALVSVPPLTIAAARIALGALLLLVVLRAKGGRLPARGPHWVPIALVAALGSVVPFSLISYGERSIDSGLAAMLMATVPLFTVLVAHLVTDDEKLDARKLARVAIGFGGVALLAGPEAFRGIGAAGPAQAMVAGGALCYALSSIVSRRLSGLARLPVSAAILALASAMIVPVSLVVDRPWTLSPGAAEIAAVAVLGLGATAAAQLILLEVVALRGASFLSMNNYLVPVFGVLWGVLFLGESPGADAVSAFALVLIGVVVSQGGGRALVRAPVPGDGPDRPS